MSTDTSDDERERVVIAGGNQWIIRGSRRFDEIRIPLLMGCVLTAVVFLLSTVVLPGFLEDELVEPCPPTGCEAKREGSSADVNLWASGWLPYVLAALVAVVLVCLILFLITRRTYMKNQNEGFAAQLEAQEEYHRQALEKLRKTTELATLMELNQGQIGEYHRIVTNQADKAFKSSRTAMGVGLFLLVCAAFGGVYVPLEEIRWFIAALAAFSTLLSGYLSRTYMILYRESISQLNRYFDQPVLNSYYLTAERLTAGLDREHVVAVRRQIIDEVLATSARLGAKPSETAPGSKPKRKPTKKAAPKRRVPKQGAASRNGQAG